MTLAMILIPIFWVAVLSIGIYFINRHYDRLRADGLKECICDPVVIGFAVVKDGCVRIDAALDPNNEDVAIIIQLAKDWEAGGIVAEPPWRIAVTKKRVYRLKLCESEILFSSKRTRWMNQVIAPIINGAFDSD